MTTMSIKTFMNVASKLPGRVSVLLRGPHGIGKSQVVRQLAKKIATETGIKELENVIDRRLSQMTEGDMVGLPSTDGEVTRFNPPDWYKECCLHPRTLLLDELNRATPEVMQAAFQVVLDFELNGWKLHPQTRVYAAVNTGGAYTVNEMDPALLDRFWAIDLEPTVEDWTAWARDPEQGNLADIVVDFIAGNDKWLDAPKDSEPGKINPSRRSWERLSVAATAAGVIDNVADPLFYPMCLGFIGTEATIAFHSFAKTVGAQVTGEEVLQDYGKVKKKVAKLGQEKQNVLIEKVTDFLTKNGKPLTDVQGSNLGAFMKDLPGELRVSLWSKITQNTGTDNLALVKSVHKWCVESVLEVFNTTADPSLKAEKNPQPASAAAVPEKKKRAKKTV